MEGPHSASADAPARSSLDSKASSVAHHDGSGARSNAVNVQEKEEVVLGGRGNRNRAFKPAHVPLQQHPSLQIHNSRTAGPLSFLNPTKARFHPSTTTENTTAPAQHVPGVAYTWTSRNNRKGRHALAVSPNTLASETKHTVPRPTSSSGAISRGLWRMVTVFPVWDISYDVATIFTLGSVVWVINAFFVWLPLVQPDTEYKNEELYGGGITAFIGATIFEVGSFFLMAEAVNENRTGCFGWAVERALSRDTEGESDGLRYRPSKSMCSHHHRNKRNLVGKRETDPHQTSASTATTSAQKSWVWFPSIEDLRAHYIHELGFLASFTQLLAATIFWISGCTALPGIYDHMSHVITIIFYWTPQVIGGTGFIISGFLFMLETQSCWYKPAPRTLGWWIGAWNMIGGIGFTMCPAFGYDESSWAQYQACLSTFWGSWAFLIGSVIQWYESLEKYPVVVDKTLSSDLKG